MGYFQNDSCIATDLEGMAWVGGTQSQLSTKQTLSVSHTQDHGEVLCATKFGVQRCGVRK